jgi:phosphate-selective porin OprO/OprP
MLRTCLVSFLVSTSCLAAAPAFAQQQDAAALAAELAAMRAKIESLEAKVRELQAAQQPKMVAAPASPAVTAPAPEKAAPAPKEEESGFSLKVAGRLQYDVGHVGRPAGVADRGLGFSNELRRGRLGVQGTIPGGFGYRAEVDFADNNAEITNAFLSYDASEQLQLVVGQHNNFQALEEITSSLFLSFMERAAFTDAFNFERKVGLSATFEDGPLVASLGVFTDNIRDLSGDAPGVGDENKSASVDGRLVYAPKLGATQLHFGGSAHWRDLGDVAATGLTTRYRQRPFIHTTDTRFIGTPALRVKEESHYGLEFGALRGPFHAAGEVHWLRADTATAGLSPTFFGFYAEVGLFLTGETRGYKPGRWERTTVRKPVGGGGFGALQLNLRYDHLDLSDDGVRGGKQGGYQASLVWIPRDQVRFYLNYGRMQYEDAVVPAAGGDRDYGIDVLGARAQVDF